MVQQIVLPIKDSNVLKMVQDTLLDSFRAGRRNYTIFQVGKATLLRVSDVMTLKKSDVFNPDGSIKSTAFIHDKKTGKVVAVAINTLHEDCCEYSTMKADPQYLNSTYPYYGLIFEMNRYYLDELKLVYVNDGVKSITGHSNIQTFLIDKFNFRKAYCRVQIVYQWWFKLIVVLLYPFRSLIPVLKVRAILNMEEVRREMNGL